MEDSINSSLEWAASDLESLGSIVEERVVFSFTNAGDLWMNRYAPAVAKTLDQLYAGRPETAGPLVQHLIRANAASSVPTRYQAESFESKFAIANAEIGEIFSSFDLILAPIGAFNAFDHDARVVTVKGVQMSVFRAFGYSQAANVFGLPAIAIPVGRDGSGLPVGAQLIGPRFSDFEVLQVAELFEQESGQTEIH